MDGELQYVTWYNELSLITYFTHELRIPYFVSYESPPDRGSMVENWYLRVNEPLGLLKRNFQTNNYFVFWAPKDFHWCLLPHYDPNLRDFYYYRKEIWPVPLFTTTGLSATSCADYYFRISRVDTLRT